jgi:CCR4-NOT transcription complex subunit 1
VPRLLEHLRIDVHTIATSNAPMPAAFHQLYPRLEEFFEHWVQIFQGPSADRDFLVFAGELEVGRVLKSDETTAMFFRVCMETSVNRYIQVTKKGSTINPYLYVDALSRLIVLMIRHNGEPMEKEHNLKRTLTIVLLVLSHQHEEFGPQFHQKPFFRFFSSLLSDLHSFEDGFQAAYHPMIMNIWFVLYSLPRSSPSLTWIHSETFQSLQPVFFPGFVFSWMALISHRLFLPKVLITPNGEVKYSFRLLIA